MSIWPLGSVGRMKRAVWDPSGYGGDQSIAIRLTDDFFFWKPSRRLLPSARTLVFYDDFSRKADVVVGRGTISRL